MLTTYYISAICELLKAEGLGASMVCLYMEGLYHPCTARFGTEMYLDLKFQALTDLQARYCVQLS